MAAGADSDVVLLGRHSSIFRLGALHRPPRLVLVAKSLGLAVFVHGGFTQQGRVVEIHHLRVTTERSRPPRHRLMSAQ